MLIMIPLPLVTNNALDSPISFDETNLGTNKGTGNEDVYFLINKLRIENVNYRKCSSELADLVPPKRVTVRSTRFSEQMHRHTLSLPKCRTGYYTSSFFFFLEPQPFGTPSPMNAFQQITISQHSRGGSISFCCSSNL